jgi:tRNA 2-selenouridine synthase
VYIEAESKKVGNLRVPDCLMEKMRSATCIVLELAQADRVQLLLQDYAHFVSAPQKLIQQMEFLRAQHSNEQIQQWQSLALAGNFPLLVSQLLQAHYDPAYLRSMERNFQHYPPAKILPIEGIAHQFFAAAALKLIAEEAPPQL